MHALEIYITKYNEIHKVNATIQPLFVYASTRESDVATENIKLHRSVSNKNLQPR